MTERARRLAELSPEEKSRLLELLRNKKQAAAPAESIPPRDRAADPPPLSFAQQRLWFLDRLRPGDPVYNIPTPLLAEGPLDVAAFRRALDGVVARHEALRTVFTLGGGGAAEPVQVIAPSLPTPLPVVDLGDLGDRLEAEVDRLRREEELWPFDLATGPLLRSTLLRLGSERHLLLLTIHHIVSDGWSGSVLIRDLTALYGGAVLEELPIQYADFAVWQRSWLSGAELEKHLSWWRERLTGAPGVLELPSDRPRGSSRSSRGGVSLLNLEPSIAVQIRELARSRSATPFVVLLAAFQTWLHRLTGQEDLCVGTPVANRERPEIAGLIGFFVNTLVLRGNLAGDPSFGEMTGRLRTVAFDAFAHQEIPFEKIVEELRPERETGRPPLVQVSLVLQNFPRSTEPVPGLRVEAVPERPETSKLDLTLTFGEESDGFSVALQYSSDLFDTPTAERLVASFVTLTAAACANPALRLSEISLLSVSEQAQLLWEWNDTADPPADPSLVHQRFARHASLHPERPALVAEERIWTWGELALRVEELTGYLRSLGVGPEDRVAMAAERTPEVIAGMLAVLQAGGVWVPLDPGLPAARREELLKRSGALLLSGSLAIDDGGGRHFSERRRGGEIPPGAAAYIIFTSGSTGEPKGVVVEHRQLRNYVDAILDRLELPEGASWALVSTLAADLGHTALFPALCSGGTLHLISPERALDPESFTDYCARHRIDAMKIVPSHLAALLAGTRPDLVLPRELLVLGGEATPWELAGRIADHSPDLRVLNHYGPTETTVGAVAGPIVVSSRPRSRRPPLGRPLANLETYVLDRGMRPMPVGVPGELFLGGEGVARGYLGQPDRTAERFVPHPFASRPGARVYRTGDLARLLPDGTLEFLGRADDQVKIRGFRVEPGEVEAALVRHPDVRECAVLVRQAPGGAALAAYVAFGERKDAGAEILRGWLAKRLPAHMIPAGWAVLDTLPLTGNGKVDRQALAAIEPERARRDGGTAPRTTLEREVASVWSEVLGLDTVSVEESFFDLGGHSLLLPRVQLALRERLGLDVPLIEMFAHPTVGALAARLERGAEAEPAADTEESRDRVRRQRQGLELQRQRLARRRSA